MFRYAPICAGVVLCLVAFACAPPAPPPPAPVERWPANGWPASAPEAQGVDSNVLANALETLRARRIPIHSLLIERNGYLVLDAYFYPYTEREPHDVASVTKSITSMLMGVALAQHPALDLNSPLASLLPEEGIADPLKSRITLAELLSMTSGLDCSADSTGHSLLSQMETSPHWTSYVLARPLASYPGSRFDYCAGNMQIVSAALTRATGASALMLSRQDLFGPMGITDVTWPADPDGISHGFADVRLKPRDLAKLGYLWLHGGRWEDKQIVPADYLRTALAPHTVVEPGIEYGFGMWLYPGHTPYDFEANGRGGQRITVIPDLNAVVVMTGGGMDANAVTPLILSAFRTETPLPANVDASRRLSQTLASISAAPPAIPYNALPPLWQVLAGRIWLLPPNPLGVQTLRLDFSAASEATLLFGFADGSGEVHAIGLDGVPRLSPNLSSGLNVAVSGHWTNDAFEIDYDEVARIDDYRLVLRPETGGLSIRITERSGLADETITAQPVTAVPHLASVPSRP